MAMKVRTPAVAGQFYLLPRSLPAGDRGMFLRGGSVGDPDRADQVAEIERHLAEGAERAVEVLCPCGLDVQRGGGR